MLKYILRRIFQMIPTVLGVILLTFFLFNVVGGDLAAIALGKKVSLRSLQAFDEQRGLDKPLFFGWHAQTRAYEDQDFSKGAGRWSACTNAFYDTKKHLLHLAPQSQPNPLAFPLKSDAEYEWKITFRGKTQLAGEQLESEKWITRTVRFSGQAKHPAFEVGEQGVEIRKLTLRRLQENPFDSQLFFYLKQIAHGDLGYSEYFKQPVSKLLKDGILPSLSLTVPIFFIGLIVSILLALLCAFFRDTRIDRSLVWISVALMSINYLVFIVAGQYILAYRLNWFPVWGYESWRYLLLPTFIGVVSGLGANIRFYRTVMLDEMYKDYVRTAFAKGVSKPRLLFVHILKNAMIPIITNVVIAIPFLYTGSLLLENFFGIPGLGYLSINAIMSSDIDVVRALVLIGALLFVAANLLTDLCYAAVDPRVKLK
jgi:peptide/nickel transport system permease protein